MHFSNTLFFIWGFASGGIVVSIVYYFWLRKMLRDGRVRRKKLFGN